MTIIAIIPARYASTRFPGKPLTLINGKTMIRHVYERTTSCNFIQQTWVATDSQEIYNHVLSFNGKVVMTSEKHQSGTERCGEVATSLLNSKSISPNDIIINVQGDEPFIATSQIETVAQLFKDEQVEIATLRKIITRTDELESPNTVKVVCDENGKALYFSRSKIPFIRNKETDGIVHWKHIGIYGYRVRTLLKLVQQPSSMLEKAESLEQLRWLEHGCYIQTGITNIENISIDTPEDLLKIKDL